MSEITEKFTDIIRNKMTDKQFEAFAKGWQDPDELCERMEEWFNCLLEDEQIAELKTLESLIK